MEDMSLSNFNPELFKEIGEIGIRANMTDQFIKPTFLAEPPVVEVKTFKYGYLILFFLTVILITSYIYYKRVNASTESNN